MIGIIIALLVGYWLGKNDKVPKQIDVEYTDSVQYDGADYSYIRSGESVRDLT